MFASGSKKACGAYITISTELPADERDLSRIGELVESAKEQYKHERGVSDAMVADEDELVSLADMSLDGIERVLVVDPVSKRSWPHAVPRRLLPVRPIRRI